MDNVKLLVGVIGGTLIMVLAVAYLFSGPASVETFDLNQVQGDKRHVTQGIRETQSNQGDAQQEATEAAEPLEPVVTITEFSDFQCPACRASQPLIKQILETYEGQVELVFRHFPIENIHKNARLAAVASEVAGTKGVFWPFHDLLFENQSNWEEEANPISVFEGYLKELGVEDVALAELVEQSEFTDLVEADVVDAYALKINSTPTFFVDDQKVAINQLQEVVASKLNTQN